MRSRDGVVSTPARRWRSSLLDHPQGPARRWRSSLLDHPQGPAHRVVVALAIVGTLALSGCGGEDDEQTLTVLAAASLTETFTALAEEFEAEHTGVTVRLAFDSSATLAQQALEGAPADVLATADGRTMDLAREALATEPRTFASNSLVLVAPTDGRTEVDGFGDVASGRASYVACVPTAPCGALWVALAADQQVDAQPVSLEVDVKAVLAKVVADEADAGVVYATDAVSAGPAVATLAIPGADAFTTTYPAAVLDQAREPGLAEEFVELLLSEVGRDVLDAAGFALP